MPKQIIIIGGGISGLSLLHYLKIKYYFQQNVQILLLEENNNLGGTIRSVKKGNYIFEVGPNGFVDSKPQTFQLIKDLNLEAELIKADSAAQLRFVSYHNRLHKFPKSIPEFFTTGLLNPLDKIRFLFEPFVAKGTNAKETIYAFGKRRIGTNFSKNFLDPMVTGIYGGKAEEIVLQEAFPVIHELEQKFGSLVKAMVQINKYKKSGKEAPSGLPKGVIHSFKNGMEQIVQALGERYKENIRLNEHVLSVHFKDNQYVVNSHSAQYKADELFISTPAYVAGKLLETLDQELAAELNKIYYAPIALSGFIFDKSSFEKKPEGFGYLIPSAENKEILGVLFESNIFPNRCGPDQILIRVMAGGARHPNILERSREEILKAALEEIQNQFPFKNKPIETFFIPIHKAIPQYDIQYTEIKTRIVNKLQKYSNLHLVANYWKGVAFNDCIESAFQAAQKSSVL